MPPMHKTGVAIASTLSLLALAPAAHAGTISLGITTGPSGGESYVEYRGAPGEANRVSVTEDPERFGRFTLTDRGAKRVRVAKADRRACRSIGLRRARCVATKSAVQLFLGEGDDTADLSGWCASPAAGEPERTITPAGLRDFLVDDDEEDSTGGLRIPGLLTYVGGGAGDDVLRGGCRSEAFSDGAGSDTVRAGAGADVLLPEVDGAPDAFDGEAGLDAVSYRATELGTAPLTIDLAAGRTGPAGEPDTVAGVAIAEGAAVPDHLIGAAGNEALLGREATTTSTAVPGPTSCPAATAPTPRRPRRRTSSTPTASAASPRTATFDGLPALVV